MSTFNRYRSIYSHDELMERLRKLKHFALDMDGTIYLGTTLFPYTKGFLGGVKEMGLNYSFLNTARTMGAILELTPKAGVNFFLGFDYLPLSYASAPMISEEIPDFLANSGFTGCPVPLSWRMNLHMGLSFALGSKYGR